MLLDEVEPAGDDPCRVAAQLRHVDEEDAPGVAAELRPEQLQSLRDDRHHHGLPERDAFPYERDGAGQEPVLTAIEERLVTVAAVGTHGRRPLVLVLSPP